MGRMSPALAVAPASLSARQAALLRELRPAAELTRPGVDSYLPVHPALGELLPHGLRRGSTYLVTPSLSLLLALLAGASAQGSWAAAIGLPELGAEAAAHLGVDPGRLVLVPHPGDRWLTATMALIEVLPVVVVRPAAAPRPA